MGRSYFHLHLVSDATGETLIAASRAVAAQYQGVASIEHVFPLLRSRALLLLTSKTTDDLATPEGKGKLAGELVTLARAALAASKSPGAQNSERGVADVHFSSFIIQ